MELLTQRLCLRRFRQDDAVALAAYRSLPEVARFQDWTTFDRNDAARLIAAQADVTPNTPGTWLQWALVLRDSQDLVGDCGIHFRKDEPEQVKLGITLSPAHQGRGLATEGLNRILEYVFESLGKHRASALTDADNHAAAALFRRLGFRQEAHFIRNVWFKGAWGSELIFAQLNDEWRANIRR
jgi:RimJ/RimL family protein N-acetyltransferase